MFREIQRKELGRLYDADGLGGAAIGWNFVGSFFPEAGIPQQP